MGKVMDANRQRNAAAQKWRKIADALVASQQGKSESARARWAKAIAAVMKRNASEHSSSELVKQIQEFVLSVLKVFVVLALAWFFYVGQEQKVENKIPCLGEGDVVYETFHTPALGYVEAKSHPIA